MPLWFRAGLNLTEAEVRYALDNEHIKTFQDAAAFLHCSAVIFVKYAKMYYDAPTGLNLHQLFKKKKKDLRSKGIKVNKGYSPFNAPLEDIFAGKHPNYDPEKLQNRLIIEGVLLEQCNICGFSNRRIKDYKVPLRLAWLDHDIKNHELSNLELVCYNCFFLYYGEVMVKRYRVDPQMYKKDRKII